MPSDGKKNSRKILFTFDPHEKYVLKSGILKKKYPLDKRLEM
jgi:hypothetical protein